jgi:diacylglycerol kinase family enzyme
MVIVLHTGRGKTMGVLPLGTLNHFAKDLHVPLDLDGAVRTIVDLHVRPIRGQAPFA